MDTALQMPEVDVEGYLVDPADWSEAVAEQLARLENLKLGEDHWDVIRFIRASYDEHQIIPDARFAMQTSPTQRLGKDARNKLFELFPYGYVKQACKIAGMRRPRAWSAG